MNVKEATGLRKYLPITQLRLVSWIDKEFSKLSKSKKKKKTPIRNWAKTSTHISSTSNCTFVYFSQKRGHVSLHIKKTEILPSATSWMEVKGIMPTDSQVLNHSFSPLPMTATETANLIFFCHFVHMLTCDNESREVQHHCLPDIRIINMEKKLLMFSPNFSPGKP